MNTKIKIMLAIAAIALMPAQMRGVQNIEMRYEVSTTDLQPYGESAVFGANCEFNKIGIYCPQENVLSIDYYIKFIRTYINSDSMDITGIDSIVIYTIADSAQYGGFHILNYEITTSSSDVQTFLDNDNASFDSVKGKWTIKNVNTYSSSDFGDIFLNLRVKIMDPRPDAIGDVVSYPVIYQVKANNGLLCSDCGNIDIDVASFHTVSGNEALVAKRDPPVVSRPYLQQSAKMVIVDTTGSATDPLLPVGKFRVSFQKVIGQFYLGKWVIAERGNIDWWWPTVAIVAPTNHNYDALTAVMRPGKTGAGDSLVASNDTIIWENTYASTPGSCRFETTDTIRTYVKKDYKPYVRKPYSWRAGGRADTVVYPRARHPAAETAPLPIVVQAPWLWDMQYSAPDSSRRDTIQLRDSAHYRIIAWEALPAPAASAPAVLAFAPALSAALPLDTIAPMLATGRYTALFRYKYWFAGSNGNDYTAYYAKYGGADKMDSTVSCVIIYPHYLKAMPDSANHIRRTSASPSGRTQLLLQANDSTPYGQPADILHTPANTQSRVRLLSQGRASGALPNSSAVDSFGYNLKGCISLDPADSTSLFYTPIADSSGVDSFRYILYYRDYNGIPESYDTAWAYVYIHSYALHIARRVDTLPAALSAGGGDTLRADTLGRRAWNYLTIKNTDPLGTDSVFNILVRDTIVRTEGGLPRGDSILRDSVWAYLMRSGGASAGGDTAILLYRGNGRASLHYMDTLICTDSSIEARLDTLLLRYGRDSIVIQYQSLLARAGWYPRRAQARLLSRPSLLANGSIAAPDTSMMLKTTQGAALAWDSLQADTAWVYYLFHSRFRITQTLESIAYNPLKTRYSPADINYFPSNDSVFLKGDTLVYLLTLSRECHTTQCWQDSVQAASALVVRDTFFSIPSGRGIIGVIKTDPSALIIDDTIVEWRIAQLPRGRRDTSLRLWLWLADTTYNGDTASGKDYLFVGDTIRYAVSIDSCAQIFSPAYFASMESARTADTFGALRSHPYIRTKTKTYTVYPSKTGERDTAIIALFDGDTIARYKPLLLTANVMLWHRGDTLRWRADSAPARQGGWVYRGSGDTVIYSARINNTIFGADTFQYVVWYRDSGGVSVDTPCLARPASLPLADTGWVFIKREYWLSLALQCRIDTIQPPHLSGGVYQYYPRASAMQGDTMTADTLRQPFWNELSIINRGGSPVTHIWLADTLSAEADTAEAGSFDLFMINASGITAVDAGKYSAVSGRLSDGRAYFALDYFGTAAGDSLRKNEDTLRLYYRSHILKTGVHLHSPRVRLYDETNGQGYDPDDDPILTLDYGNTYAADTAYLRYIHRSPLRIVRRADSIRYLGQSIALADGEREGKFLKGDTLVYLLTAERASAHPDSVQRITNINIVDSLINLHPAGGGKYGKFIKTLPVNYIGANDSVLHWRIAALEAGQAADSLWVHLAWHDNNAVAPNFADSSVLLQNITLLGSSEADFNQTITDTARIFSLYDLRLHKLAGSTQGGAMQGGRYLASKNSDTLRFALRLINGGRRSRFPKIVIGDTLPANLRLLNVVEGNGIAPQIVRATAADTLREWTLTDAHIGIGDTLTFIYDALFRITPPQTVLITSASAVHLKTNGSPAINRLPANDSSSVTIVLDFAPDSVSLTAFAVRGTARGGRIVPAPARDARFAAYDGDTLIFGAAAANLYRAPSHTATNINVICTLSDTALVRFLPPSWNSRAAQEVIPALHSGERDTVYFYGLALRPTPAVIVDSIKAYWSEIHPDSARRSAFALNGIGNGTIVQTEYIIAQPSPFSSGKYRQGQTIPYRIRLRQTAGWQAAQNIVVRAALPPELSKAAIAADTLALTPANTLPLLGGDTLLVIGRFKGNRADTAITLYAIIDGDALSVPAFRAFHDSAGYAKWRADTAYSPRIDPVMPNSNNLWVTIKPIIAPPSAWLNQSDSLFAGEVFAYVLEVRSAGDDARTHQYTLTFTIDPRLQMGGRAVFGDTFAFANNIVRRDTVWVSAAAAGVGSYINIAEVVATPLSAGGGGGLASGPVDLIEKTLKDNRAADTLAVVSRIDVGLRRQAAEVLIGSQFVEMHPRNATDTIHEGDTLRLTLILENLRRDFHLGVSVRTSRLEGLTFAGSPNNRPPLNDQCVWDPAAKTLAWHELTLLPAQPHTLQAIMVVDTIAGARSAAVWRAWINAIAGDLNSANDTTPRDTLPIRRSPYDLALSKSVAPPRRKIDDAQKTLTYTIALCNRRTQTLFAQIRDAIPPLYRSSLQFDSIAYTADGAHRSARLADTAFVFPARAYLQAEYPFMLKIDPASCLQARVYASVKRDASVYDFPFVNTASALAFQNNALSVRAGEAALSNNSDTASFALYDNFDLRSELLVFKCHRGICTQPVADAVRQGDTIEVRARGWKGALAVHSAIDSLAMKISISNGRAYLTQIKTPLDDSSYRREWTTKTNGAQARDSVRFEVSGCAPDSTVRIAVTLAAFKGSEGSAKRSRAAFAITPGAALTGYIEEIETPAINFDKKRAYQMKVYHKGASAYTAYNLRLQHLLRFAVRRGDYKFTLKTFSNNILQTDSIRADSADLTDTSFAVRVGRFARADTLIAVVRMNALMPSADAPAEPYLYNLSADALYAYNAADSAAPIASAPHDTARLNGFISIYRNPYDVGVWILNRRLLGAMADEVGDFTAQDTIARANAAAPHLSVFEGDTLEFVLYVRNLGSAALWGASVEYAYDTSHLRLVPGSEGYTLRRNGIIRWENIALGGRQSALSGRIALVAASKGIVADTARIDTASLPAGFNLYRGYAESLNDIGTDSAIIFSHIKSWVKQGDMQIMTMFSPNGDGINDFFEIKELNDPKFADNQLTIFDRYGNAVYESARPYDQQWQGAGLPDGVYFYKLDLWLNGAKQPPIVGPIEIRRQKK